jgi:polar amino acid transport system substrate-binding protein
MAFALGAAVLFAGGGADAFADVESAFFADSPFPPYTIGELGEAPSGGIAVEIAEALFSRLGIELRIQLMPWRRVLKTVQTGRADGVLLLMRTEEREQYLAFTDLVYEGREVFVFNRLVRPSFAWETFSDVKSCTLGLVEGYTYGEAFLSAVDELDIAVDFADSTEQNLAKLAAGRVDLVVEDKRVVRCLLGSNPKWQSTLAFARKPVTVYPYYMGISLASPLVTLLSHINGALGAMREDGTMAEILAGYQ